MPNIVEQKAIELVLEYEKKQGRNPIDVSKKRCGYDIESNDRFIEVKGQSSIKAGFIWINNTLVRTLGKNLANYYIYIIYDIKDKPKIKILEPDIIFKNLQIDTWFLLKSSVINEYGKDAILD